MARMKELDIDFISLVNKGANKQTVKIYKSNEKPLSDDEEQLRGFFNIVKNFFSKDKDKKEEINKSEYITDFNKLVGEQIVGERIKEARWALMDCLENILMDSTITDKALYIGTQIDAFKTYVLTTINTAGVQKSIEQIQEIKKSKEGEEMTPEAIKKMLEEALNPIKEELKVLKGDETDEQSNNTDDNKEPTQEEIISKAIQEATSSLKNEIEELKKSRKASQSLNDTNNNQEQGMKKSYISAFSKMYE